MVSSRAASFNISNVHAEGDAEDGGLGILRREGGAGAAREIGRHGGDSDGDYEQPEAVGRGGRAAGAGRANAARHYGPGERQKPKRATFYKAGLHTKRAAGRPAR